jgi:arylsulfatase A-like enzyme
MYPLRLAHQVTGASLETLASVARPTDVAARVFTDVPITLPQLLKQAGYRTVSFTGGGWMGRNMGFAEGFDVFDDKSSDKGKSFRRAFRWLRRNEITAEQPTFLFVHAYDIHCPFVSRAPYDTLFCNNHERHAELVDNCAKPTLLRMQLGPEELQAISDHYDGGIASADAYLGEIIGLIKELGLYEEALIIVTSDHGDSFGEHEQIGHGGLYFEQLMVPLIMKLPASWGIVPARVEGGVELVDVMPTLLESAGVSVPPDLDGRSLLPVMAGAASTRRYLRAQITFREGKESISSLGKRAILEPSKWLVIHDVASAESEAFDLHTDRAGLTDVGADRPEDVQALLDAMLQRDRAMTTGASVQFATPAEAFRVEPLEEQLDSNTIEQLRSLGYID